MLKANSLLYAVYICLIVSILCGALLFFANLYNQLNLFYTTRESLYIENQSAVNFALENIESKEVFSIAENRGILSELEVKSFGLFTVLQVNTFSKNDTISSTHFVGQYATDKTCLYLTNFSRALSYSGKVTLKGNMSLPSSFINEKYLKNEQNVLVKEGNIELSTRFLPKLNPDFEQMFNQNSGERQLLKLLEKSNDSVYYNPFTKPVIEIQLESPYLDNIIMKGNFILHSKDSIIVKEKAFLNDVILKAPKVTLADNFEGSVQVFATERIEIGSDAVLNYPSALCLFNTSEEKAEIVVKENTNIQGGVVLFGNSFSFIDENRIILKENTILIGDIYSTGKVNLQGKIFGSVYCNSIFHGVANSSADNCLHNTEIDVHKRPDYFVSLPLFNDKKHTYGIIKKVF
jgi:cytoskeletal protein CcmA (bactofilin family)